MELQLTPALEPTQISPIMVRTDPSQLTQIHINCFSPIWNMVQDLRFQCTSKVASTLRVSLSKHEMSPLTNGWGDGSILPTPRRILNAVPLRMRTPNQNPVPC
ncbi:unnamed protein product [Callosobruchus maculatus]|uniref:Uncharacterized protein n=1 Tax=Callosobruchus maculatus TaxID=64391 RepID=A0A653CP36_CALMS|nr:unnamed protein product [Callosobruchus maculatus]